MDLEKKLARKLRRNRASILNDAEVELLAAQLCSMLATEFPHVFGGRPAQAFQDQIRWGAVGARCQQARDERGLSLKEAAVAAGVPRYRAEGSEKGRLRSFRPDLAWRYFSFLGLDPWFRRWARANPELTARSGLAEVAVARRERGHGERAKDSTGRSSGRTRASRPLQSKGRAARSHR